MNSSNHFSNAELILYDELTEEEALSEKLLDAQTPDYQTEFDPDEAENVGAFVEDALTEEAALESDGDRAN